MTRRRRRRRRRRRNRFVSKKHPRYDERKKGRKKERGIFLWSSFPSPVKKKKGKTNRMDIPNPRGRKSNLSRARARTRVERKSSQTPPHSIATASNAFKSVAKISRSRFFLVYARRLMRPIERAKICAYARRDAPQFATIHRRTGRRE